MLGETGTAEYRRQRSEQILADMQVMLAVRHVCTVQLLRPLTTGVPSEVNHRSRDCLQIPEQLMTHPLPLAACLQHMSGGKELQHLYDDLFGPDDEYDTAHDLVDSCNDQEQDSSCMPCWGSDATADERVRHVGPPGLSFFKSWLTQKQQVSCLELLAILASCIMGACCRSMCFKQSAQKAGWKEQLIRLCALDTCQCGHRHWLPCCLSSTGLNRWTTCAMQ